MAVPPAEASRIGSPQSVLLVSIPGRCLKYSSLRKVSSLRALPFSSKKQQNATTSKDLTTTTGSSMLGPPSARGDMVYPGRLAD